MLKFFKKRNNETTENTIEKEKHFIPKSYNEDEVRVFYEGEVLSLKLFKKTRSIFKRCIEINTQ